MYLLVIYCLISTLVSANPLQQQVYKLPLDKILMAQKHVIPCAKKHNVDTGILKRVVDGTLPHDEASKKFLLCFGRSANLIAEDGHIIVDRMSKMLGNHALLEEFKESLRNCNKITKENPYETVIEMNSCINNNSPITFGV